MDTQATEGLLRFFQGISDPRASNARHVLSDILAIAIMGVLCGSEGWAAVEGWATLNAEWLATFLRLLSSDNYYPTSATIINQHNHGASFFRPCCCC